MGDYMRSLTSCSSPLGIIPLDLNLVCGCDESIFPPSFQTFVLKYPITCFFLNDVMHITGGRSGLG